MLHAFDAILIGAATTGSSSGAVWALVLIVGVAVGAVGAVVALKLFSSWTMGKARGEAEQIIRVARAEAEAAAQKAQLEGERAIAEKRKAFEAEAETARAEAREDEKRLKKREDLLDRKLETLAVKEDNLARTSEALKARETKIDEREGELEQIIDKQKQELMRVADMTMEQARETLLTRIEGDTRAEAAKIVRKITEDAQSEAKEQAREITLMAIQRFASEHTAESTVRTVEIPSDDMKGRIIGREGRNIRAIEKATGVDILVDDTPGVIAVSCFDKVRQAIAVEALQKLVSDGRVHPSRIEEVVEGVRKDMDERIVKFGKDAVLEANLRNVHPKVRDAMGKLHFRTSYGQNVLRHSIEVAFLCQLIAEQLGLDGAIARRCGFLHDIGKSMDHEMEGGHPKIGMDFARTYGEKEPVLNAIGGHHADMPATSFYTPIVMAADAISGARPGARRESLERYIQRLEQLQDIALNEQGVTEAYAIQAGREVRVMVDASRVADDEAYLIAKRIADRVGEEMTFPGEIRVTVLRETRAIEIAR
ncbi:MAG: ribonuclease Y [Phycisphaerales bacterium]|nr:MAG: ribonuclease Y [Phycisphaerales bacterium]